MSAATLFWHHDLSDNTQHVTNKLKRLHLRQHRCSNGRRIRWFNIMKVSKLTFRNIIIYSITVLHFKKMTFVKYISFVKQIYSNI